MAKRKSLLYMLFVIECLCFCKHRWMHAFAGMTNMSTSFCRHSGESRRSESHAKMRGFISNQYRIPDREGGVAFLMQSSGACVGSSLC